MRHTSDSPHYSGESGVCPPQAAYAGLRRGSGVFNAMTRASESLRWGGATWAPAVAAQARQRRYDQVTRVSTHPAGPPGQAGTVDLPPAPDLVIRNGPVEWVMSRVIRRLAWSPLSDPMVALSLSGAGLLLGMIVGATAPNAETVPVRLPLSCTPAVAGPFGNQRRHRVDPALHREHPGLPGPGRDAVGAQPGLAPQPQAPAVGQHGDHRGHGEPHPGGLLRHRQLRGVRPDRRRWAGTPMSPTRWRSSGCILPTPRPSARCGRVSRRCTARSPR